MRYFLLVLIALTIVGCSDTKISTGIQYQLISSSDGYVYRLDGNTGEVMIINQGTMSKVSQSEQTNLVINGLYKTEEGKIIRYIGKGKFVPRP